MNVALTIATIACLAAGNAGQGVIDLKEGWRFCPDPKESGVSQGWSQESFADDHWRALDAGKPWEEQGFPDLDGYAWYRKRVTVPAEWAGRPIWLVLGAVNDSYVLFCNGERIGAFGDKDTSSLYETPTVVDLSARLKPGSSNLIALQVLDWSGSGGLWRLPCLLTTDAALLPNVPMLWTHVADEQREVLVEASLQGLPADRSQGTLKVDLFRQNQTKPFATQIREIRPGQLRDVVTFPIPRTGRRDTVWRAQATAADANGKPWGNPYSAAETKQLAPRHWPAPYAKLKVLNNCVTELLDTHVGGGEKTCEFLNPRDGWVFFSVAPGERQDARGASTALLVDSSPEPLRLRANPDTGVLEAMNYVKEGKHILHAEHAKGASVIVRAVPFLGYTGYPSSPPIADEGAYDWAFMEKYVLSNVNTIIVSGPVNKDESDRWRSEGRVWLAYGGLPSSSTPTTPKPESVVENWLATPRVVDPGYGGVIIDEFVSGTPDQYAAWQEAVNRLHRDPRFAGKTFYGYCGLRGPVLEPKTLDFYKSLAGPGNCIALERYLEEQPTVEAARAYLLHELQYYHRAWADAIPGFEKGEILNLGFVSMPTLNCDVNPGVDYKVYLEMQLRLVALDPQFWGTCGIQEWVPQLADEENVRWCYKLFRHYFIEGSRELLSRDPYLLPHIQNPDFMNGLQGWRAEPAVPDSLAVKRMEGFGALQGRNLPELPRTGAGDSFLWMKRVSAKPNKACQTIKALKPGQLYSLRAFSADFGALEKKQKLALSFDIQGADVLTEGSFQSGLPSYSIFRAIGPYDQTHPIWLNVNRVLFRAKRSTAELTISDWAKPNEPGGPAGQELAVNFIEVQPFLAP